MSTAASGILDGYAGSICSRISSDISAERAATANRAGACRELGVAMSMTGIGYTMIVSRNLWCGQCVGLLIERSANGLAIDPASTDRDTGARTVIRQLYPALAVGHRKGADAVTAEFAAEPSSEGWVRREIIN